MHAEYRPPIRLPKRPKARWYLLALLSTLAAAACLVAGIATAIWQDSDNLDLPAGQVKLALQ